MCDIVILGPMRVRLRGTGVRGILPRGPGAPGLGNGEVTRLPRASARLRRAVPGACERMRSGQRHGHRLSWAPAARMKHDSWRGRRARAWLRRGQ